ncbi:hypothetical protein L596_005399 [Steinernema carpocapsae]|uniref:Uncharacterized protein n=1 Tax=Steinernema carpocapsae TaxID=34508 RepID=A0A4U8UYW9_STECR|nr:hypothetical protein L596_005399 [Steinernema carpocapsae]
MVHRYVSNEYHVNPPRFAQISEGFNAINKKPVVVSGVIHACKRNGAPRWPRLDGVTDEVIIGSRRTRRPSETSSVDLSTASSGNIGMAKLMEEMQKLKLQIQQLTKNRAPIHVSPGASFDDDGIGSMADLSPVSSEPPSPGIQIRSGFIPPPPPPPPVDFLRVKVPKLVIGKRSESTRAALNDSKSKHIDMMDVLKDMGSVKLRKVPRSPGGTPMRTRSSSGKNTQSDPGALIGRALREKFQSMQPYSSSDESDAEGSFSSAWADD